MRFRQISRLLWAAFAEPVTIGIHACRRARILPSEYVLVLGCGPIGLAIVEVALAKKASVVAVDVNEQRLETARSLGAEVLPGGDNLVAAVLQQTNQEGAPVVIEATGNPSAIESTVDLVAPGGRIVIVGLTARAVGVKFPGLDFTRKELTILGSRTEVNCFPEALALLASGTDKLSARGHRILALVGAGGLRGSVPFPRQDPKRDFCSRLTDAPLHIHCGRSATPGSGKTSIRRADSLACHRTEISRIAYSNLFAGAKRCIVWLVKFWLQIHRAATDLRMSLASTSASTWKDPLLWN